MARVSRTSPPERRLTLDRASKTPLHAQISSQLRAAVESGALQPGTLIENEIDLSAHLGVSRPTLQKAIAELVTAGYLTRKPGRGTVVLPRTFPRQITVGSLYDDLAQSNRTPSTTVLAFEPAGAPKELLSRLGTDPGPLVRIERIRAADGEPLAILRNWLPAQIVDFDSEALAQHGLYELLRQVDIQPRLVEQRIGCRRGTPDESALLGDAVDDPVLTVQRVAFDEGARFIEYGQHSYRAGRYFFETVMVG